MKEEMVTDRGFLGEGGAPITKVRRQLFCALSVPPGRDGCASSSSHVSWVRGGTDNKSSAAVVLHLICAPTGDGCLKSSDKN